MLCRASLAAVIAALSLSALPSMGDASDLVTAKLRPGWQLDDGRRIAGLHLTLEQGWKTYWRAPGDAGIPPQFDWSGSDNLQAIAITWPTPFVFWESGMRSIGYEREVMLPLVLQPQGPGQIIVNGTLDMGICKDVCIPYTIQFSGQIAEGASKRDPMIVAALADVPYSAREADVASVTCSVDPTEDGLTLTAEIQMPSAGGAEQTVIEAGNPLVWVAQPKSSRNGRTLTAQARMMHIDGGPFALDRSAVRITVLGQRHAVDIRGCG